MQALQGLIGQLAATESGIELDEVRVVRMPDGKDPDEVLRDTPDRWREEVRTAQPIVEYLVDTYAKTYDLKTPGGKARFVDALMPTIRAVPNPVMRDALSPARPSGVGRRGAGAAGGPARRAARRRLGLAGTSRPGRRLRRRLGRRRRVRARAGSPRTRSSPRRDSLPVSEILRGVLPQEAEFLRLLLLVPELQLRIVDSIGPDQLPSTVARELFRAVVLAREPNDEGVHPPFSLTALIQGLDPETASLAQARRSRAAIPNPRDLSEADLAYELERLDHRPRGALARRARRLHQLRAGGGRAGRPIARRSTSSCARARP